MAAKPGLTPAQLRLMSDSKGAHTAFHNAWSSIAPSVGASAEWGKAGFQAKGRRRVAYGQSVKIEFYIKADPKFQAFLRRLDTAPAHIKKEYKRILRQVVRKELLPELRRQVPRSDRRKKHLRSTVSLLSVNLNRAIVGVGGSKNWYAAIVHAGRTGGKTGSVPAVPFFPRTFKKVWHPLNRRLLREMADLLTWIDTGHQRRRR